MESLLPMIIQLVSGAVGGNAAGAALKNLSLGSTGNSVVGAIGRVPAARSCWPLSASSRNRWPRNKACAVPKKRDGFGHPFFHAY